MAIIDSFIDLTPLTSSLKILGDDVRGIETRLVALEEQNQMLINQNLCLIEAFTTLQSLLKNESKTIVSDSFSKDSTLQSKQVPIEQIHSDDQSEVKPKTIFFGAPQSLGFAMSDEINTIESPKALYEVNIVGDNAKYRVLTAKYQRLKLNVSSLLSPVCHVEGNAEASSEIIVLEDGELHKEEKMWVVKKPCIVQFQ